MSKFSGRLSIINKNKRYKEYYNKLNGKNKTTPLVDYVATPPTTYVGEKNRFEKYNFYDLMQTDSTIETSLNVLSDFVCQGENDNGLPFNIKYNEEASETEISIISEALKDWCKINKFKTRIFDIVKDTLKYGDYFFIRDPENLELLSVDPYNIENIVVDEAKGKEPQLYRIKNVSVNLINKGINSIESRLATPYANQISPVIYNNGANYNPSTQPSSNTSSLDVDAKHVIHICLNPNSTGYWPFGPSILEKAFKAYKQKELLEDAAVIYRIQRAPERRVFKIDVSNMPTNKAQAYIERFKNEIHQKRMPSRNSSNKNNGVFDLTDSSYNPLSMLDDYYLPVSEGGKGTSIEVLPGGANLNDIPELLYFDTKIQRAMDIPSNYFSTTNEESSKVYNAGKLGEMLVVELRFANKIKRLQNLIISPLDEEFKHFILERGDLIDTDIFTLEFNDMMKFKEWIELELQSSKISQFKDMVGMSFISKELAMKDYLGWSEEKIKENKRKWAVENPSKLKEKNIDLDSIDDNPYTAPGLSVVGVPGVTTNEIEDLMNGEDEGSEGGSGDEFESSFGGEEGGDMDFSTDEGPEEGEL